MDEKNTFQVSKEKFFFHEKSSVRLFHEQIIHVNIAVETTKSIFFPDIYMLVNRMYAQNIPYICY